MLPIIATLGAPGLTSLLGSIQGAMQDDQRRAQERAASLAQADARWANYPGPWAWPLIHTVERTTKGPKWEHTTVDVSPLYLKTSPGMRAAWQSAAAEFRLQHPWVMRRNWEADPTKDELLWFWDLAVQSNIDPRFRAWRPYAIQYWRTPKGVGIRKAAVTNRAERWNPAKRQWERYVGRRPIAWWFDFKQINFPDVLPGGNMRTLQTL